MHLKRLYRALAIVITVAMILPQTWISTFAEGEEKAATETPVVEEVIQEPVIEQPVIELPAEPESSVEPVAEPTVETKPEPTTIEEPVKAPPELGATPLPDDGVAPGTDEEIGATPDADATPDIKAEPTITPTEELTPTPTETPTEEPTPTPTEIPTEELTPTPTQSPIVLPTRRPVVPTMPPVKKPKLPGSPTPIVTPTAPPKVTPIATVAPEVTRTPKVTPMPRISSGYNSNAALIAAQQIVMPPIEVDKYRFKTIEKVYAIAREHLVIKEEQSDEARDIGELVAGGLCFVIEETEESEWLYVESGTVRGFLKISQLMTGDAAAVIVESNLEENMVLATPLVERLENEAYTYVRETVFETKAEKVYAIARDAVRVLRSKQADEEVPVEQADMVTGDGETTLEEASLAEDSNPEEATTDEADDIAGEEVVEEIDPEEILGELPKDSVCNILAEEEDDWLFVESEDVRGFVKKEDMLVGEEAEKQLATGTEWTEERAKELVEQELLLEQKTIELVQQEADKEYAEAELANVPVDVTPEDIKAIEETIAHKDVEITQTQEIIEEQKIVVDELKMERDKAFVPNVEAAPDVAQLIEPEANGSFYYTLTSAKDVSLSEAIGDAMIEFASQFLGNPYVWGGTSLTNGADCSGFVQGIYDYFGYKLPRTSGEQSKVGMQIPVSEARKGDLIFYAKNGVVYHVVMFIEENKVIHASSSKTGIITSGIDMEHAVWAIRMISDEDQDKVDAINAKAGTMIYGNNYTSATATERGELLGNFKLTAYCNCVKCCGKWAGGPTASGTTPTEGRTVAMAGVPFGTKLIINGKVYTVEDRGTPYGHVDIYMNSHEEGNIFGVQYANVYAVK